VNWTLLFGGALLAAVLAGLLYWQLELAEGVYLGSRVVIWLYDRYAGRYDAVKQFDVRDEAWFLGGPLAKALQSLTTSCVLDVATGTARLPLALFRQPAFTGRVIGLDLSRQMLHQAAAKTRDYQDRLTLIWQDATVLPFPDDVFDAVTCLEALEFLPHTKAALAEMVRVLRPGGILLTTNRTGPGVHWLPGRTMSRQRLTGLLESLSLEEIKIGLWQIDYDLVSARKPSSGTDDGSATVAQLSGRPGWTAAAPSITLPNLLVCPICHNTPLSREDQAFSCDACGQRFPVAEDGVVEMTE
jgi:ubiquinone/menaquinone biosynthesis C-methylase UbiE